MKSFLPLAIRSLLFGIAIFSIPFLYKEATLGFRPGKLVGNLSQEAGFGISPLNDEVAKQLRQPFFYLGQGTQCFVFESLDRQVVIKLFRRQSKKIVMHRTALACQLAFERVPAQTGLLYLHLSKTDNLLPCVMVQDRIRRGHHLPLDRYAFILQKKAELFRPAFFEARQKGVAIPLIESYLQLAWIRSHQGICNPDITLSRNVGFIGGQAVEIDFGSYRQGVGDQTQEFQRSAEKLGAFLEKYSPELLEEYKKKMELF